MSTGKLTQTTFISGPRDELAPIDVYEQNNTGIQNNYHNQFHDIADTLDHFLSQFGNKLKQGTDLINNNLNLLQNLSNQLNNGLNIKNPLGSLDGFKNNPIGTLKGILGGSNPTIDKILNTAEHASHVFKEAERSIESIKRTSESLKSGLNGLKNDKPLSLHEKIEENIKNYGSLNPNSNNISESINHDLEDMFGGDKTVITNLLEPNLNRVDSLNKPTTIDKKIDPIDKEQFLENIKDPDLLNHILDLSDNAQDLLINQIEKDSFFNHQSIAVNGETNTISHEVSLQNKEAIGKILNTLTNSNYEVKNKDTGKEANLVSGITHIASKAGFPNVFENLSKKYDKDIMRKAAKPLLLRASEEGDFEIIKDIANTEIKKDIKTIVPNIIENIITDIKKPHNLSQQEYSNYYKSVKDTFNKIDPQWDKKDICNVEVINCCCISKNKFFCDLLEAQLNELLHPDNNLSNKQVISPMSGINDSTKLLNEIDKKEPKVEQRKVTDEYGIEYYEEYTVEPKPYIAKEILKIDPNDYNTEKYLLLGKVFIDHTVDREIQKHFPFFYNTLENKPIVSIPFI